MVVSAGWYRALWSAVARGLAALHRRLHRQQPAAAGARLQRPGPDLRRRRTRPGCRRTGGGGGGGGAGGSVFGGEPGIGRMFGASMGTEISWLLPAALIGLVAGLWFTRRPPRTDRRPGRPAAVGRLAGGDGRGVQLHGRHHPPVLHGRAGPGDRGAGGHLGARTVAGQRPSGPASGAGGDVGGTGVWAFVLLDRTPDWLPGCGGSCWPDRSWSR